MESKNTLLFNIDVANSWIDLLHSTLIEHSRTKGVYFEKSKTGGYYPANFNHNEWKKNATKVKRKWKEKIKELDSMMPDVKTFFCANADCWPLLHCLYYGDSNFLRIENSNVRLKKNESDFDFPVFILSSGVYFPSNKKRQVLAEIEGGRYNISPVIDYFAEKNKDYLIAFSKIVYEKIAL